MKYSMEFKPNDPPRKVVAYRSRGTRSIYLLKAKEDGGGVLTSNGQFISCGYDTVSENIWRNSADYEPVCEGDSVVITVTF